MQEHYITRHCIPFAGKPELDTMAGIAQGL